MIGAIERLYRCMQLAFGRGRVTFVDDSGPVQKLQVKFGAMEIIDNLPAPHDFGFTSNPPIGSDVFASFMGGNRTNGIAVTIGSQVYRMKNLASGEVAIYDNLGQSVHLTQSGIVIQGAGLPITIHGDIKLNGSLDATGDVKASGVSLVDHLTAGVKAGADQSGKPIPT
jgi:phage gp45-like